ncbi:APC family permease [Luteipulveratus sp. YIM 133132]|uniref:APC family permease n=1 Tax=Luteipulveratus flavus TaxID=3031728 RepID=UPI0023AFA3FF|nr:APC family permease [Luteipulveratus sp. YIM 133132]MDE9366932.1 APC family permease [Luteipulveratus sp. YIM 133132]
MTTTLARRLGLGDAVTVGLGSMIGAGVFAAFAPAAAAAGSWLLVGLALAAVVAFCNATSSGQLAAQYPASGGTYVYGRERLGPWWGYLAGWCFVIGKTASCAAMAMTAAAYAVPDGWQRPVAAAVVLAVTAVNLRGVTRTALATKVIVGVVLVLLAVLVVACLGGGSFSGSRVWSSGSVDLYGIWQSAGLLFFAFAGYARIATMGEEVRDPRRTIPLAILIALSLAVVVYVVVGISTLGVLGADRLAGATAPLADAAGATWSWAEPLVRVAGALAATGALLALVAGVGRTSLAMAREGDLPRPLAAVHPTYQVPHRAELTVGLVVAALVLVADLRGAIGFSSFGVLLYYAVANASALTQSGEYRIYPRALQVIGLAGCLSLVATLPWRSVALGVVVLVVGIAWRLVVVPRQVPRGVR